MKDLNVEAKTIKLLGENVGVNLGDLRLGKVSLDMLPKSTVSKEKKRKTGIHWK